MSGPGEVFVILLVSGLGVALRLAGAGELPWDGVALAAGVAAVPIGYALLRPLGAAPAFALALLVATSPWHVHASRAAGATTIVFLAMLAVAARLAGFRDDRDHRDDRFGRAARVVVAIAAVIGIAVTFGPSASAAGRSVDLTKLATLLAADVGLAIPLLALVGLLRGGHPRTGIAAAFLFAIAGARCSARQGLGVEAAAWWLPLLFVVAARELGRWLAALESRRARLAFALVAVVPTLPSLVSEQIDGGRYDLAALEPVFARARRGDERLYASDPELAARALHVEARPLSELPRTPPPEAGDRAAFVLLLLDRGQVVGGETLPADLESQLDLVARSGRKRLDLHRFEARLYRRAQSP